MEVLVSVLAGIIVIMVLLGTFLLDRWPKWSGAERRAAELLGAVLTADQSSQLVWQGYLDIPSPAIQNAFIVYHKNQGVSRSERRAD